jgi:hypothetical protein
MQAFYQQFIYNALFGDPPMANNWRRKWPFFNNWNLRCWRLHWRIEKYQRRVGRFDMLAAPKWRWMMRIFNEMKLKTHYQRNRLD